MSYARGAYGRAAYGGGTVPRAARPGDALVIPGFESIFYWTTTLASAAYGSAAYGGRSAARFPSAGLAAVPDPSGAVTNLAIWWAFADVVSVIRIDPDGQQVPVRDSEALAMPAGTSRRNRSSNPSARDSLTGYTAGSNTTLSRLTDQDTGLEGVTTAVRGTATAAGTALVGLNIDQQNPGRDQYAWRVRTSALAATLGLSIAWYDSDSLLITTQTYLVDTATRTAAAAGWTDATVTIETWPGDARVGVVSYVATGLPAGGTLDVTARLRETVIAGGYFDGDSTPAAWIGTPGLSYSETAALVYVRDFEAPLDVPVTYRLTSSAAPGYVATSEEVTLPSVLGPEVGVRQALLTHPGLAHTMRVWIEAEPDSITNAMPQGVFEIDGRRHPVVITAEQRSGDRGTLTFIAETFDEAARIRAFLDDGSPLLLRTPAAWGHPPNWWLSFGDLTRKAWTHQASRQLRRLEVPFIEVSRPSLATRPLAA